MAIDPEVPCDPPQELEPLPGGFEEIDADRKEAADLDERVREELVVHERAAPKGWRIDVFGTRFVSAPPWSRRPPTVEPEPWITFTRKVQQDMIREWKSQDPAAWRRQEERRRTWELAKKAGKVPALVASAFVMPALSVASPCPSEEAVAFTTENRGGRKVGGRVPGADQRGGVRASESSQDGIILGPMVVARQVRQKIISGEYGLLFIEVCCQADSMLATSAPDGCLAIRVTATTDLTNGATKRLIHNLIQCASRCGLAVHAWISIPCTSACRIRYHTDLRSQPPCDPTLARALIEVAIPICRHLVRRSQHFTWEWPETSLLWTDPLVQKLMDKSAVRYCSVSTAAVGFAIQKEANEVAEERYLNERWRLATTHATIPTAFAYNAAVPADIPPESLEPTMSSFATLSAYYTPEFAKIFWNAIAPPPPSAAVISATEFQPAVADALDSKLLGRSSNRCLDAPRTPFWCSLVTRQVTVNSEEGRSDKAAKAIEKERKGHEHKGSWDFSTVREYADWMADPKVLEAIIGRVFITLGVKNDELTDEEKSMKARAVFQGNNIRSKTGISPWDIFGDTSNAPASLLAARCGIAVAMLRRWSASLRDADQAYLQAILDESPDVVTLVELPKVWWPEEVVCANLCGQDLQI